MHTLRNQLLKIQRAAYKKNLKRINETFKSDAVLDRYSREYHKYLRSYNAVSSKEELLKRVCASDIVYMGDYHPLRQSQRSVLRILREIVDKRDIVLCLEIFHHDDQRAVDQYMKNEISQKELLTKINYAKKWHFKWENWRPIIAFCKEHAIPVKGTNSNQDDKKNSLLARDVYASKIIGKLVIQRPCTLIFVVDGDYHIAPCHLPYQVEKRLAEFDIAVRRTVIYQNDAGLYWQLAHDHKEEANVLAVGEDSFCIMSTTPANKLQSYLSWLEYSVDAYYPVHADWEDLPEESEGTSISSIVKTVCSVLDLPYPEGALERLEIYYGNNLDFMGILSQSPVLSSLMPTVREKIKSEEAFLLEYEHHGEDAYLIYLPNSSLNMAAEEATHFLNAVLRGRLTRGLKPFDAFYLSVLTEAVGFFGSKLVNEKRKVQTRHGIRKYLRSFKQKLPTQEDRKKIVLSHLILQHRFMERVSHHPAEYEKKFTEIYRARTRIHRELATQLGYMLGDKLYYAVKKRKFPLKEVIQLFNEPFSEPRQAFTTYLSIAARVGRKKVQGEQF